MFCILRNIDLEVGREVKKIEDKFGDINELIDKVVAERGKDFRTLVAVISLVDVLVEKRIIEGSEFIESYKKNLYFSLGKY